MEGSRGAPRGVSVQISLCWIREPHVSPKRRRNVSATSLISVRAPFALVLAVESVEPMSNSHTRTRDRNDKHAFVFDLKTK